MRWKLWPKLCFICGPSLPRDGLHYPSKPKGLFLSRGQLKPVNKGLFINSAQVVNAACSDLAFNFALPAPRHFFIERRLIALSDTFNFAAGDYLSVRDNL